MTAPTNRDEALAWLAGRLRWERLLEDLRSRSAAAGRQPDQQPDTRIDAPAPQRAA